MTSTSSCWQVLATAWDVYTGVTLCIKRNRFPVGRHDRGGELTVARRCGIGILRDSYVENLYCWSMYVREPSIYDIAGFIREMDADVEVLNSASVSLWWMLTYFNIRFLNFTLVSLVQWCQQGVDCETRTQYRFQSFLILIYDWQEALQNSCCERGFCSSSDHNNSHMKLFMVDLSLKGELLESAHISSFILLWACWLIIISPFSSYPRYSALVFCKGLTDLLNWSLKVKMLWLLFITNWYLFHRNNNLL